MNRFAKWALGLGIVAVGSLLVGGCSRSGASSAAVKPRLLVYVPCGMERPFMAAQKAFQAAHPEAKIELVMDNANILVRRVIDKGEKPDLIVSPGLIEMGTLEKAGKVEKADVHPFGRYELVMFTSRDNPAKIKKFSDLTKPAVQTVALANPSEDSVGFYAKQALTKMGLWDKLKSKLQFSDDPITAYKFVARDKAQASFAYRSCPLKTNPKKLAYSRVRIVESVPKDMYNPAYAVIAVMKQTPHRKLAQAFVDYLLSDKGQILLKANDVPLLSMVHVFVPCGMLTAFMEVKQAYEKEYPGSKVKLTFDRADALTARILKKGEIPDVHCSIGEVETNMLVRAKAVKAGTPVPFGRFRMALAVNRSEVGEVKTIRDLLKPDIKTIVLTPASNSSVGHYARQALESLGIWKQLEPKVKYLPTIKDCYSEIAGGRADAGFAYIGCPIPLNPKKAEYSKVKAVLTVPEKLYGSAIVYASVLTKAAHTAEAWRFVHFLTSPENRAAFERVGLMPLKSTELPGVQSAQADP